MFLRIECLRPRNLLNNSGEFILLACLYNLFLLLICLLRCADIHGRLQRFFVVLCGMYLRIELCIELQKFPNLVYTNVRYLH